MEAVYISKAISSKAIFKKAFIQAWTLEETESVPLNLGKCWKPKNMNKPRMQTRVDKEEPIQREGTH